MSTSSSGRREGSLEAPTRHPVDWRSESYYDESKLMAELERVYDICHGCRRCVSLCQAFPTLFDLVDESDTLEVDGVAKADYWKVVDHCYLCDLCYLTMCPYVPPHEWNIDFPHLMLQAKAIKYRKGETKLRDRLITQTDTVGKFATLPVVSGVVNAVNRNPSMRKAMDSVLGIHPEAVLPPYASPTARGRLSGHRSATTAEAAGPTTGKVAIFVTCYGNYCEPVPVEDMVAVLEHNGVEVTLVPKEQCCGMPRLELGDLQGVARAKEANIPVLARLVEEGYDIIAPVPSCVLMFKQELPLMFPEDAAVQKVKNAFYDPFEYLHQRHRAGKLRTDFARSLGKVSYHVACHQRVQRIGMRTRDILSLVPDTQVMAIERCSGHDGTYAVKSEFHDASMKIVRPVVGQVKRHDSAHLASDCPMAANHIAHAHGEGRAPSHPISLLRTAYGV
ncbi:MAG: Fe-S oxidoreductase [Chromatiales bacterium]|nr:Fe-S oxidoreductase [Chromatiales bacterium]